MNKKRIINGLVIGLILINLVALGFFFMGKDKKEKPGPAPMHFVIEKLNFDQSQIKQYRQAIKRHKQKMSLLRVEMESTKKAMFENLATEAHNKDSLISAVGVIHLKIERNHYDHFEEIKKLCRPDQMADFAALSAQLAQLFAPHPPPKRHRKH